MKDFIFQNARIKANESKMLDRSDFEKLIKATDENDIISIFNDKNGTTFISIDEYREHSEKAALSVLKNNNVGQVLDPFIIQEDYKNLKTAIKSKYTSNELKENIQDGLYTREQIKTCVNTLDKSLISGYMVSAIEEIEREKVKDSFRVSQYDEIIDRWMYKEILRISNKRIKKFFEKYIELVNLNTLVRCKLLGLSADEFGRYYISSNRKKVDIATIYSKTSDEIYKDIFFGEFVSSTENSDDIFSNEINLDIFALKYWSEMKFEYETECPIIVFYYKQKIILKLVNLMYCLKKFKDTSVLKSEQVNDVVNKVFNI